MPSSLATQLAASVSLNASLLLDHSSRSKKVTESYLFTGRDADAHDLDSIHALASSAFTQLCILSPAFSPSSKTVKHVTQADANLDFERVLFSDAARAMDRTMQTGEMIAALDRTLAAFLRLLGPWLMEMPTSKVLEWLVRRFRIHEFNVEDVLSLFLPYHESPHFVKMLSILHIQPNSTFSFLLPYKSAGKPLSRNALVNGMLSSTDVARFVVSLFPAALQGSYTHRTLLSFHLATMHDYFATATALDEGTLAFVLPSLLAPFQSSEADVNSILGSYILLSTLSHKTILSPAALSAILVSMASVTVPRKGKQVCVPAMHFVRAAIAVCASQEELPAFGGATTNIYLRISNFADEIQKSLSYVGAEKFIMPLLECIKSNLQQEPAFAVFAVIVNAPNISSSLLRRTVKLLVDLNVSMNADPQFPSPANSGSTKAKEHSMSRERAQAIVSAARQLLSLVHQRHFDLLQNLAGESLAVMHLDPEQSKKKREEEGREKEIKRAEGLLMSLSISHPLAHNPDVNEVVVASSNTSKEIRLQSVQRMYELLKNDDLEESDKSSLHSALQARIYDTYAGVLRALYAEPELFLSTLSSSHTDTATSRNTPTTLLKVIISLLDLEAPSRSILSAHLSFLVGHFCVAFPELLGEVLQQAVFPFLLASQGKRFRIARAVWQIIQKASDCVDLGWLTGCADVWSNIGILNERDTDDTEEVDVDRICTANFGVATKIAENILASDEVSGLSFILRNVRASTLHARNFAYLVVRGLLLGASPDRQVYIASEILQTMSSTEIELADASEKENIAFKQVLEERQIGMVITTKSNRKGTLRILQASILALIPAIQPPAGTTINWLANPSSGLNRSSNDKGEDYLVLMRRLYILISTGGVSPTDTLCGSLLKGIFMSLKEHSLSFLLGILLSSPVRSIGFSRHSTLLQILAFLRGHANEHIVDFQTIMPSLMYLLVDSETDQKGRDLIFDCLSVMSDAGEKKHVYGYDTIYGKHSEDLQYLDTKDFISYLTALIGRRQQVVQDASQIKIFHKQHFTSGNAKYQRRVLCFFLSHIIAHPIPQAQIALLRCIEDVSDASKSRMLAQPMKELVDRSAVISAQFGSAFEEYTCLMIAAFLTVPALALNDSTGESLWPILILAFTHYLKSNSMVSARAIFAKALNDRIFETLNFNRQAELCTVLLEAGSQGGDVYNFSKEVLGLLLRDVRLICYQLARYQPAVPAADPRSNKRAKVDGVAGNGATSDMTPVLTLLAEVLASQPLSGSLDLISQLLETLNAVAHHDTSTSFNSSYIAQLLMSAIENVAEQIKDGPMRAIRLDILVELIRVSDNPQIFHQALLLMSALARLTPDSVLHNIMPIFTFMGSNVFHRDDAYSFRVVQKTIESIVPVMTSSLKSKYSDNLELYVGSRDFLRIFTDASNHIPRHRRSSFFTNLVEVLGPEEFLAPVCMLLVDRVANRVTRQTHEEVQAALNLPITILRHFPGSAQLNALVEALRESQRLISSLIGGESANATFLDYPRDEEHSSTVPSLWKRRAQSLIIFTGHALLPSSIAHVAKHGKGQGLTDLMTLLVTLATVDEGTTAASSLIDISSAAHNAIPQVLGATAAADFLGGILTMLSSEQIKIQSGALELFAERIAKIVEKVRHDHAPSMNQIITKIGEIIGRQSGGSLVVSALHALKAIGHSVCSGEEVALADTIPLVLKVSRNRSAVIPALAVLPPYVANLGPRIIPFFRPIIDECVSILREGLKGSWEQSSAVGDSLSTLQGLLLSIPAFWGKDELTQVIKTYTEYCTSMSTAENNLMTPLAKSIAKRAPAKILLSTTCETWTTLDKSTRTDNPYRLVGFFNFYRRVLHATSRSEVAAELKTIFKIFVDGFAIKWSQDTTDTGGESAVISCFLELVAKLNESTFRPLFRRLYDWAFAADDDINDRKITFCHVYISLLEFFKGLMTPYMAFLLQPFSDFLQAFANTSNQDNLWLCVIETVTKSVEGDDGVFWRDDKLRQITPLLTKQVSACIEHDIEGGKDLLMKCLNVTTGTISDDALLKTMNLDLLMHTRSENARLRIFALSCSEMLWKEHGGKLLGFVAETATFISECAEDENDVVVREARKLKNAVESVAGNINGL